MKTIIILRKFFQLTMFVIVCMAITTCDLLNKDDTPPKEHCTSDNLIAKMLIVSRSDFQYTYYCIKEGDDIILGYFSDKYMEVCPTKLIKLGVSGSLSIEGAKPIQVITKVSWQNDFNIVDLPLDKDSYMGLYTYTYEGYLDLSSYYLGGDAADIKLQIFFRFFSSGNVTADQDYLKSVLNAVTLRAEYYPY